MMDNDTQNPTDASPTNHRALATLFGLGALFLFTILMGFVAATLEDGSLSTAGGFVVFGMIMATAVAGSLAWSHWRKAADEPEAASAQKSRNIYLISSIMGGVLGAFIMIAGGPDMNTMFSNNPISPTVALVSIVLWGIGAPLITAIWFRVTDEHEIAAYSSGALFAFHAYIFAVPSWWMAARAGFLPQQDPMIIWAGTILLWSIVWLYKKYA